MKAVVSQIDNSWVSIGKRCENVHDTKQWREFGFATFDAWIEANIEKGRDYVYKAMRIVRELDDVPEEKLKRMWMENAASLAKLPREKRSPELIEKAFTLYSHEFKAVLQEKQRTVVKSFRVPVGLAWMMERAVEKAKDMKETDSSTDALEMIFSAFLAGKGVGVSSRDFRTADKRECVIYVLRDPQSGEVNYVGRTLTSRFKKRMNEHKNRLGYRPKHEIVERCSRNGARVEKEWVNFYRDRGQLRNYPLSDMAFRQRRQQGVGPGSFDRVSPRSGRTYRPRVELGPR